MRELIATPAFLVFVLCTWPAVAAFHTHSGDIVADTLAWYAIGAYFVFPHVAARVDGFLDPHSGDTYQIDRSLEAFMNGGLFGRGRSQQQGKGEDHGALCYPGSGPVAMGRSGSSIHPLNDPT